MKKITKKDLKDILNCIVADKEYSTFYNLLETMRKQSNKYLELTDGSKETQKWKEF